MFDNSFKHTYTKLPIAIYQAAFDFGAKKYEGLYYPLNPQKFIITSLHYHNELEIIYISHGEAEFTVNNRKFSAHEGEMIIINPYDLHYADVNTNQGKFCYTCIDFDLTLIKSEDFSPINTIIDSLLEEQIKFCSVICPDNKTLLNFQGLYNCIADKPDTWGLQAKAYVLLFFSCLIEANILTTPSSYLTDAKNKTFTKSALNYIQQNYTHNVTSLDAAETLNYDKSYFCRLFRKNFNDNFSNYLNFYRLNKAKALLEKPGLKISDVAILVGFDNFNYFSRLFKEHYLISPSEFRSLRQQNS